MCEQIAEAFRERNWEHRMNGGNKSSVVAMGEHSTQAEEKVRNVAQTTIQGIPTQRMDTTVYVSQIDD